MRLNIVKSANAEQLYIIKSFRKGAKNTSRIMKKLGTMASLLPQHDNNREKVIAWAKEEARLMTLAEKSGDLTVLVEFTEGTQTTKEQQMRYNGGYLFLKGIYHQLSLPKICDRISSRGKEKYDLSAILEMLIYSRVLAPASKLSSYEYARCFLEQPSFQVHDMYRSLNLLAKHADEIQAAVYEHSEKIICRNKSILYYDCTNFFFEMEEADGMKQYGKSKEHRPNPIVQMGLFLDGDGLPLSFVMFPGNQNEQPTLKPLEQRLLRDFGLSKFVVCTDAGLASTANRRFNDKMGRSFVVTQPLKTLKKHLKDWALDPEGWYITPNDSPIDISQIKDEDYIHTVFYKERWIIENGMEQRFIVTYSPKYKQYQQRIREHQVERALKIVDKGKSAQTKNPSSPSRFVEERSVTFEGEIADRKVLTLDEEKIQREAMFDGFYGVCTTLVDDASHIIHINKQRWQIEAAFRTMKTEFKARPVYLQREDRIEAHFLTCFLSLLILNILERKMAGKGHSAEQIIHTLRDMDLHHMEGIGYLSSFTRTDVTDNLHDTCDFRLDSQFISEQGMKKIIKNVVKA